MPTWRVVVLLLGLAFLGLAALFIALPGPASTVFGIPQDDLVAQAYVRALGFRDLALGLYLVALILTHQDRAARWVLGLSIVIPVMDFGLVLVMSGTSAFLPLLLHGLSGAVLLGLILWQERPANVE